MSFRSRSPLAADWQNHLQHSLYLSLLQYIQTISGAHPSSFSVGTRFFAWGKAAEMSLTTLLHLVQRLKNEWSYAFGPLNVPPWCVSFFLCMPEA